MKIFKYVSLLSFFAAGCTNEQIGKNEANGNIKSLPGFKLSRPIDSLLQSYIKENTAPAYAIFIDKKDESLSNYMITIAPFSQKVKDLYEPGAVNYILLNDTIPVFIYSGIEDYVVSDSSSFTKKKVMAEKMYTGEFKYNPSISFLVDFSKSWSYIYRKSISTYSNEDSTLSYIVRGDHLPFISITLLPPVMFTMPDSLR